MKSSCKVLVPRGTRTNGGGTIQKLAAHSKDRKEPKFSLRLGTTTSVDIAREAKVSQSTVSLVLNGRDAGRVSRVTRERIQRIASQMGYQPHAAARALKMSRSHVLALVVPDVSNPFFARVLGGAEREARTLGYALVLAGAGEDEQWEREAIRDLASHAIDAFAVWAINYRPSPRLNGVAEKIVLIEASSPGIPSLHLDVGAGTALAIQHLLDLGHRRIGHLAMQVESPTFRKRRKVFKEIASKAGLADIFELTRSSSFSLTDAHRRALELLQLPNRPTAIFCDDDLLATGVYKAARDLKLAIPRDISVVGFNDGDIALILEPALTTVAIPAESFGARIVRRLVSLLEGMPDSDSHSEALSLQVRASTASPLRTR